MYDPNFRVHLVLKVKVYQGSPERNEMAGSASSDDSCGPASKSVRFVEWPEIYEVVVVA